MPVNRGNQDKPDGRKLRRLAARLRKLQPEMLRTLRRLVAAESPSYSKAAVDRCGELLANELRAIGARAKRHRQRASGDHLEARFEGRRGRPVLLLGHHDTVWEMGTLRTMPFRVSRGRVFGPGTLDMKCGLVQALFALRALQDGRGRLPRPVIVLINSDEEVGSETSRPITERLARKCAAVFVLEPAQGRGALKTSRKGVGDYTVEVQGRASHAGVDFAAGASAVHELARQVRVIEGFAEPRRGITVNVGVIRGGTRTNVVAAEAAAGVDVRIQRRSDAARLEKRFRGLRAFDKRCKLSVAGGINRPPMERSRGTVALFRTARRLAAALDPRWRLEEAATGGGSDGNFTAALGIPTLDGLGAVGEGAHARNESVLLREMPRRAALLAALIATI